MINGRSSWWRSCSSRLASFMSSGGSSRWLRWCLPAYAPCWRWPLAVASDHGAAGRANGRCGQAAVWQELSFQLSPASRPFLVFLLSSAALTFILAWRTYQGRTFYPLGLALVALWTIVALVRPLIYAPLALVLVAILAVFVIQAGKPGDTRVRGASWSFRSWQCRCSWLRPGTSNRRRSIPMIRLRIRSQGGS